jgi:hypothetical protein
VALVAVRDRRPELHLTTEDEVTAFELDLLSEYALARAAAGITDKTIRTDLAVITEAREWLGRPLWEMRPREMDRFVVECQRGRQASTKANKVNTLAIFFEFLELRHRASIYSATGHVVESPVDEMNRPKGAMQRHVRIPPTATEIKLAFKGRRCRVYPWLINGAALG